MTGAPAAGIAYRADVKGLPELVQRSENFERVLRANLQRNMQQAAIQILAHVSQEVRSGSYAVNVGLREGIASGLRVEAYIRNQVAGVQIISTGSGLPEEKKVMARAWQAQTFRHSVFGHEEVQVEQAGHPYFFKTIEANRLIAQRAVEKAMTDTAKTLSGGA